MTYIVKVKQKNRVYAYKCTAYWDKEKQQPRQKREYVGIVDKKTGKIKPKRKSYVVRNVKASHSYGDCYFFKEIVKKLKLDIILKNNYSSWKKILSLSFAKLKQPTAMHLSQLIIQESYFEKIYEMKALSSQQISGLLEEISSPSNSFFKEWIELYDSSVVFYDITSFSSYSKQILDLEYGYNRDHVSLPQINFGMIVSQKNKLPLYYKKFPGSIPDVVTLNNLSKELKLYGINKFEYVLDLGFFSEKNITMLDKSGIDFLIPLLKSTTLYKELIEKNYNKLVDIDNSIISNGNTYFALQKKVNYKGYALYAYLYQDEMKKAIELNKFIHNLKDVQKNINKDIIDQKLIDDKKLEEAFPQGFKKYLKYFEINIKSNKTIITRKNEAITKQLNNLGKFILLSRIEKDPKTAINSYRDKDAIEKDYNLMKNYIQGTPLRVHKIETLEGLFFLYFITTIIKREVLNQLKLLRENKIFKKITAEEIFLELSKIKKVTIDNKTHITEISKKQRDIFEAFKIEIPS